MACLGNGIGSAETIRALRPHRKDAPEKKLRMRQSARSGFVLLITFTESEPTPIRSGPEQPRDALSGSERAAEPVGRTPIFWNLKLCPRMLISGSESIDSGRASRCTRTERGGSPVLSGT